MIKQEFSLKTPDGLKVFAQEWKPPTKSRATLVLVHGLGEHSSRYEHVAEFFTNMGISMIGFDLRGHGRSEGQRGHAPSFDILLDDIQMLLEQAVQRNPDAPCFLYGHSLGGGLVLYYTLTRKPAIRGVIATSPLLLPGTPVPAWKMTLAKILYSTIPNLAMHNGIDTDNLSHDININQYYVEKDAYVHSKISARLGLDMLRSGSWISQHKGHFPLPLLLMQGGTDHIVDPLATTQFAKNLSGDVTYKMFDRLYHELHNELEKEFVFKTFGDWLDQHL